MQCSRSTRMVFNVFGLFLGLSFSPAHGENLFRWTDDAGRACYSNVSPPAGVKEYSVDGVPYSASDRLSRARASTDTDTAGQTPAETGGVSTDFFKAFLEQRIIDQKKSIGHIEALLRKHPNDSALRKSLLKKEQYLFEDLTRLKNAWP